MLNETEMKDELEVKERELNLARKICKYTRESLQKELEKYRSEILSDMKKMVNKLDEENDW